MHCNSGNISLTVQDRYVVTTPVMYGYRIAAIRWSWVTFTVNHLLRAFLNGIFRTVVQQLTRFQLTSRVARSLCNSWASCRILCAYVVITSSKVNHLSQLSGRSHLLDDGLHWLPHWDRTITFYTSSNDRTRDTESYFNWNEVVRVPTLRTWTGVPRI